jgi:hypothetical protein
MNRYGLAVAVLLSMSMLAARAQEGSIERQVRAAPVATCALAFIQALSRIVLRVRCR